MLKREHYVWCLLILGVIGFCVYAQKAKDVFPGASIDLKYSRMQIESRAVDWAHKLSYDQPKGMHSTTFTLDDDAKTFLEYELGATEANVLMRDKIPVWYWSTRFFKPLTEEEMTEWISPTGNLIAFQHSIESERAMPSITHEEALAKIRDFATNQLGVDLTPYTEIEDSQVAQAKRTDHNFTFEDKTTSYHGAHLRLYAYVSGDTITEFNHFLHVPEAWQRKYSKLRSYNEALQNVASIFYVILNSGSYFVFLWAFAEGLVRWRLSLLIGAVAGIFSFLGSVNELPSEVHAYDTTLASTAFQINFLISAVSGALTTFISSLMLVGGAETIYRLLMKEAIALEKVLTAVGLRCREVTESIFAGVGTCGAHLGWVVFFYLTGRRFGLWCPLDVQNAETLSSYAPFFSALQVGFSAALSEELLYRVLGLSMFQKLTRNFYVANILQAAAWAFMHSNYPQEPPYARGLELTSVGFIYGLVMRRFGLLACLFSHGLIDTLLGVSPLLGSSIGSIRAGAYIALVPFVLLPVISILLMKSKGKVTEVDPLTNKALLPSPEEKPVELPEKTPAFDYQPLSSRSRLGLSATIVVSAFIVFGFYFPAVGIRDKLQVPRTEVMREASKILDDRGFLTSGLYSCAVLSDSLDSEEMQYSFEHKGLKDTDEVAMHPETPLSWTVRFFKPLVEEEYKVVIDVNGHLVNFSLVKPESAAGAKLNQEAAKSLAEDFLKKFHPEISPYALADVTKTDRDNRTDYAFQFKVPRYKIADADYEVSLDVIGSDVSNYGTAWRIPDKWLFHERLETTRQEVFKYISWFFNLVFLVASIWWSIGIIRSTPFKWRIAIAVGAFVTFLELLRQLNDSPQFYIGYGTDTPMSLYILAKFVGAFTTVLSTFAMMTALAAFALGSLRLLMPHTTATAILKTSFNLIKTEDSEPKRGSSGGGVDAVAVPFESPCVGERGGTRGAGEGVSGGVGGAEAGADPVDSQRSAYKRNGDPNRSKSLDILIDAVLVGYAAGLGQKAITVVLDWYHIRFSPVVAMAPLQTFAALVNPASISGEVILDSLIHGVYFVLFASVMVGIYGRYLRSFKGFLIFALVVSLVYPGDSKYWQDWAIASANYFSSFMFSWLFVTRFARGNLMAYFLAGLAGTLAMSLRALIELSGGFLIGDQIFLTVVLAWPLVFTTWNLTKQKAAIS